MLRKLSTFIGVAGLVAFAATPASANTITSAEATANCSGYNLTVNTTGLTVGTTYTIDYFFLVVCGSAAPVTVPGSVTFKATSTTQGVTTSGTFSPTITLAGACNISSGVATLTSSGSEVYIEVNGVLPAGYPANLTCPVSPLTLACQPATTGTVGTAYDSCLVVSGGVTPYTFALISAASTFPPGLSLNTGTGCITGTPTTAGTFSPSFSVTDSESPPVTVVANNCPLTIAPLLPTQCVIPPSGTAIPGSPVSWNGFNAPAGSVVWINVHINSAGNVLSGTTTQLDFTQVTLVVNGKSYALPNGTIDFVPGYTGAPTTVVNSDGSWTTTVSSTQSGNIFIVGQAIPVDANLENGGGGNTSSTLSFFTNSNDSALQFPWQWGAAVYTSWPGNAAAMIETVPAGNLQSGAPQNTAVQGTLIQGPRGGGGSNFTGSWSGTGQGTCP
jgi:hypothetical protein